MGSQSWKRARRETNEGRKKGREGIESQGGSAEGEEAMFSGHLATTLGRNVVIQVAVGRRFVTEGACITTDWSGKKQAWSGNLQGKQRRAASSRVVLNRRSGVKRTSMASSDAEVAVEAGFEVKDEQQQQPGVAVEGNGVAAGEKSSAKQNGGESGGAEADVDHGFARPEMHSQSLVGSVGHYERHMFLCYKDPETWPSHVEAADFDRLPRHLVAALRARKNDMPKKTRLTICEGRDSSAGDVLIFPEMLRYRGLTHFDVDSFVEDVLVNGKEWVGSKPETLSGSHIFVCSHGSRDRRCGVCGPALIAKFQEEINSRGVEDKIFVRPCSHIGGHKYAGNIIVFSSTGSSAVSGHWYGYVAPVDIPVILDQHIGKGEIVDQLWRGQMGVNEEDQKQAQQNRLEGKGDANKGCACSESLDQANGVNGQNGSACCQTSEPDVKEEKREIPKFLHSNSSGAHDGHLIFQNDDPSTDDDTRESRIKLWGSYYIPLPKWIDTWEREDTHAALAVVGAAAAVAVAFHLYKRSS